MISRIGLPTRLQLGTVTTKIKCQDCSSVKGVTEFEDGDKLCDSCLCKRAKQQVKNSLNKRCPKKHWAFAFPEMAQKANIDMKKICPNCELTLVKQKPDKTWFCSSCETNFPKERFK